MIYAKVDVKLRDHTRAHRAAAAMATWTWGLLFVREQETDGHVPDEMIRLAWVGEKEARKHAAKLVEVGLWEVTDRGGWLICRYSDKNETASSIAARRGEAAERMRVVRANKDRTLGARSHEQPHAVPGSGSGSGSGSEIRSEDPEQSRATPPATPSRPHNDAPPCAEPRSLVEIPDAMGPPPAWWPSVIGTVHQATGVQLAAHESWISYAGHRAEKREPATRNHALYWLKRVEVPDVRDRMRVEARDRERDHTFAAERAAKVPGNGVQPGYCLPAAERPEPTASELAETRRLAAKTDLTALFAAPANDRTGTE